MDIGLQAWAVDYTTDTPIKLYWIAQIEDRARKGRSLFFVSRMFCRPSLWKATITAYKFHKKVFVVLKPHELVVQQTFSLLNVPDNMSHSKIKKHFIIAKTNIKHMVVPCDVWHFLNKVRTSCRCSSYTIIKVNFAHFLFWLILHLYRLLHTICLLSITTYHKMNVSIYLKRRTECKNLNRENVV